MSRALERFAARLYGAFLRAYPGRFPRILEDEMHLAFAHRCREARRRRGPWGVLGVLGRESLDLAFNAILEWSDPRPVTKGEHKLMESLLQDVRYTIRGMASKPAFAVVSIVILALAIGGTTGIFSLIDGILFTPPSGIGAPEELAGLERRVHGSIRPNFSYPDFDYLRESGEAFSDMAACANIRLDFLVDSAPERIRAQIVSESYFSVLQVDLALGRGFQPGDEAAATSVVISDRMWRQRLGADAGVVGSALRLNGQPFTVVGVAPKGFRGFRTLDPVPEVWVPFASQPFSLPADGDLWESREDFLLSVVGRLQPGVTHREAQAAVDVVAARLTRKFYSRADTGLGLVVDRQFSLSAAARQRIATVLSLLMVVVGLVLLITCANLAGLLLSRAAARRREMGIRLALGASRGRVLRLLLTESLLMAVAGGAVGLLVSGWVARFVVVTSRQPLTVDPRPDLAVLGFALAVALVTGLLFGFAPALHASRRDVSESLKGTSASGRPRLIGRSVLVVAQVALSLVLLIASGLFVRSLQSLQAVDPGFDPEGLVVAAVDLRPQGYGRSDAHALYRQLLEAVASRPGVDAATLVSTVPLSHRERGGRFLVEGREAEEGVGLFDTPYNVIGPDYFKTLGFPLVRGREFTFNDTAEAPGVVIVNESFARLIWPGEEPLGKRISRGPDKPLLEVVGLVRDIQEYGLDWDPSPTFYRPVLQRFERGLTLMARPSGEPEALFATVREEVQRLNPNLPIYGTRTLDDLIAVSAAPLRTNAALTSLFGVLALVLASVGLYGLISYSVTQRRREIGIRMALGARGDAVVRLMVTRGVVLTGLGLVIGLVVAGLTTRLIRRMLFEVSPADPVAFVVAAATLAGVALLACYLPALRASRVDPVEVLRVE